MSTAPCDHNAWLHLTGGKSDFGVRYENRFQCVIDQLTTPSEKSPYLAFFLGRKKKDAALCQVFRHNDLERQRRAPGSIRLDVDNGSLKSKHPILFADADPNLQVIPHDLCRSSCHPHRVTSLPWAAAVPHLVQDIVLNRLLFLFTDVICLFADDVGGLAGVKTLLTSWATIGSASSLPLTIRPRLLVISQEDHSSATYNLLERENFRYDLLHNTGVDLSQTFASIKAIVLPGEHLSSAAQYVRLRAEITREFYRARESRTAASVAFSGTHQNALFEYALKHMSRTIQETFDFVCAARQGNELGQHYSGHIENFLSLTKAQGIPIDAVCSYIASSVLMDAYPPNMHSESHLFCAGSIRLTVTLVFNPVVLFRTLYRSHILHATRRVYDNFLYAENICQSIEDQLVPLYNDLFLNLRTSSQIHRENLARQKTHWVAIQTNLTCLSCLRRKPEHPMQCFHSYCDVCIRIFGDGMVGFEHQNVMHACIICQLRSALIVKLLPKTAGIRILSIDGGGSHGIASLKWLSILQAHIPEYAVQDFFDLAVGTSAGGLIVLSLFINRWDVEKSTRHFKSLTQRVFGQGRKPGQSITDKIRRTLKCWVSDGYYNAPIMEDALKESFGNESRMFGYRPLMWSGSKVAVTATTVDDSTAFVISNYNGEGERRDDCGANSATLPSEI
jgi:Patatin-like phospholipase